MKTLHLSIIIASAAIAAIASVLFFSQIQYNTKPPCEFCPAILSPNQPLQILDITTEPKSVNVGSSFLIYADVSNPNPYSIYLDGGCISPISATFDKNVETKQGIACLVIVKEELRSGQEMRIQGPSVGTIYNATSIGETNATITFTYEMQGKMYNVTTYKQITISYPAPYPSQIAFGNANSTVKNNLENGTRIMTIKNQTYYYTILNDTITNYLGEPVKQIPFHNVVFTFFPKPFSAGPPGSCGNTNFGSDLKFSDNIHELLGVHVPGMPCLQNYTETELSNHTNPQAGLAVYDGKIRLLVGEENQTVIPLNTSQQCDTPYNPKENYLSPVLPNGTHTITDYTPIFYMPMNSTGKICVHYSNPNSPQPAGITVFPANDLIKQANITTSANPEVIATGNSTIVYTIKTGNMAGFYGIRLFCGGQAFAVGYDNQSRIVVNDFPWYGKTFFCPAQDYNFKITGLSGIGIYYITETTREQIGYNITGISVSSVHPTPTSQNVTFAVNVRTYNTGAKLWFDYKDSTAVKFIGDPQLKEDVVPCNWIFNNDKSVDGAQWLKLVGGFQVTDNPVTIPPYSNGTYTFSIIAKNLDYGWYGLSPIIFSESSDSKIPLENLGGASLANYYPITIGLDHNMDPSGVCMR